MHLLARFSKIVLGLALLSWPVIGYSLRMSNADWMDPIFKPMRIAADVNNCDPTVASRMAIFGPEIAINE